MKFIYCYNSSKTLNLQLTRITNLGKGKNKKNKFQSKGSLEWIYHKREPSPHILQKMKQYHSIKS